MTGNSLESGMMSGTTALASLVQRLERHAKLEENKRLLKTKAGGILVSPNWQTATANLCKKIRDECKSFGLSALNSKPENGDTPLLARFEIVAEINENGQRKTCPPLIMVPEDDGRIYVSVHGSSSKKSEYEGRVIEQIIPIPIDDLTLAICDYVAFALLPPR